MRVIESIGPAWETMKRILFRPFNIGTWFSFGFVFALQSCAEGGGGNTFRIPNLGGSGGSGHGGSGAGSSTDNAIANLLPSDLLSRADLGKIGGAEIAAVAAIVCVIAVPVVLLMFWLGSRGQMMAIRAVATGMADVGEAWRATQTSGGRMLKFQLALTGIALVVFLPLVGAGVAAALPVIREEERFDALLPLIGGLALVALVALIPLAIVKSLGRNFVAPIMLKHEIGAREAWTRFWSLGRGHVGSIVVFWLIGAGFTLVAGLAGIVGALVTCCLGFLPVIHQTMMAPYYVFERAWTLEILASMSPDLDLRALPPDPYGPGGGVHNGGAPYGYGSGGPPPNGFSGGYGGGGYGGPPGGGYGGPPPPAGGFGGPPGY
ncbi:MAG: hypothetical protein BGO98_42075 [Myxococcales bacterium 68-20]|nr:hypothetical protein [Myxococcales bacterium]OJY27843.1 MAG: hypothetical protein BGO98_42075 [Myxococcales bacterium 68-20]